MNLILGLFIIEFIFFGFAFVDIQTYPEPTNWNGMYWKGEQKNWTYGKEWMNELFADRGFKHLHCKKF